MLLNVIYYLYLGLSKKVNRAVLYKSKYILEQVHNKIPHPPIPTHTLVRPPIRPTMTNNRARVLVKVPVRDQSPL